MTTLTVGSLFSGIGGIDLGLERAGMRVLWQCEKDEQAQKVLMRRWPLIPCYDDVKELNGLDVPRVDVLAGGFPCQDLSVAGRRAGLAGERSGLFHEFMHLADELAPTWVLIENVPGLLSSNDGRDMGVVLGTLADLGYGWCYRVLDAQYFGVAQRRRRVFIVGCAGGAAGAARVLLEPESCGGDSPPSRAAREEVAGTLGGGSGRRGWCDDLDRSGAFIPSGVDDDIADTLRSHPRPGSNSVGAIVPDVAHCLTTGDKAGYRHDPTVDTLLPELATSLTTREGHGAHRGDGQDNLLPITIGLGSDPLHATDLAQPVTCRNGDPGVVAFSENQRGEVLETPYARQITTGGGKPGQGYPAVRQHMSVRRLTPLECERLQGFPDRWTDLRDVGVKNSARYRMLGNAVCVPVAEWIGRRIAATDAEVEP